MIVADSSAIMEVLFESKSSEPIRNRLFGKRQKVFAPHLIDLEISQVLRRHVNNGSMTATFAADALADWLFLPVTRMAHSPLLKRIFELRTNATAYDAAYLALAEALNAPLVTHDGKISRVPGHRVSVEVY
jgi:predicted nucleic acid-binding protein